LNLPETKPRVVIVSSYANRRAKTSIGGDYVIYLESGQWFMTDANSLYPSRELSFLELWRWLKAESEYNLTRHGTAMRNDKRWQTLFDKAEFDNLDQWDETGDLMKEVNETHTRLTAELEQNK
jgi:hypothetical protein